MEAYHLTHQKQPLEVFYIKKGLFKIWIHRKTPVPSPFFNKDAGVIKKETVRQVFSCEFWQIFKHIFFPPKLLRAAAQFFYFILAWNAVGPFSAHFQWEVSCALLILLDWNFDYKNYEVTPLFIIEIQISAKALTFR